MTLVFALIISLNGEEQPKKTSHWLDVERCRYFASRIYHQAYNSNYSYQKAPVKAYCVPIWVDPTTTEILQ